VSRFPARPAGPASDPDADPVAVARTLCLRWLTDRAHTRSELAEKLARKGVPDDAAEQVLERFVDVGLICDEAVARDWVDSQRRGRSLGRRALADGLRRKGIDAKLVQQSVAVMSDDDEREAARALVRGKLKSVQRLEPAAQQRRLAGLLARKGYPPSVVFSVVREELAIDALEGADLE
jgi:regulatory protein